MPHDDRSAPSEATAPEVMKNAVNALTVREMILLAMVLFLRHVPKTSEAPPSISKAAFTFVVWSFFPESFGMRLNGLVPDKLSWTTPNTNTVQSKFSGTDGVKGLGWVTETTGETGTEYSVTEAGHRKARSLVRTKLRGILPKLKVEPKEEILGALKIQEAFAAMKAALAGKEKLEEEKEDVPVTNMADVPSTATSERKLEQQSPETPKESPMEMVAPSKISVAMEPPTPPPPDPPPPPSPPRAPISDEDLHVLMRLAETPIAKSIFRKAPSGEESRTFLNRFDPNPNTSTAAKMASLAELVRRVDGHLTDDGTLEQIRRAILAVSRVVDAISAHFRAAA